MAGPRGVSDWTCRVIETSSQIAPRSGGRFQPAERATQFELRLRAALQSALGPNLSIVTTGLGFQGRRTIDHIALSGALASESLGVVSNVHEDGNLSDHFGVVSDLSVGDTRRKASSKNAWTALTSPPP